MNFGHQLKKNRGVLEKQGLLSTHHRFDAEYSNIRRRMFDSGCQTRIRVSGYSSNPNPGSGSRIFDLPFTDPTVIIQ